MKAPTTYAEWVTALDMFKEGSRDDEALLAMEEGELSWSSGVAERFVTRLRDVCDTRLRELGERQRRYFQKATGEREVVNNLLSYRREFSKLHRLVSIKVLPENVCNSFRKMIKDCATETQRSFEQAALQDRSGKLVFIVKNTRVEQYCEK